MKALSLAALLAALLGASPASAGLHLEPVRGHISFGYGRVGIANPPAGSISVSGGLDYPVAGAWRVGPDIGFHLLGSRNVERGSLLASVDYSVFELMLMTHWQPSWAGPVGRLSAGAGLFHGSGELSASGGGAFFRDLPRDENAFGVGVDVTLMQRKSAPVRVGFELGARLGFLKEETWPMGTARLAFHY